VAITGCASARQQQARTDAERLNERHYEPAAASALAFDSPAAPPYELLGLDRDARVAGASVGYQDAITEYFTSATVDHQSDDPFMSSYDRWTVSEKVGVRYR
jgi:hypothetical protein